MRSLRRGTPGGPAPRSTIAAGARRGQPAAGEGDRRAGLEALRQDADRPRAPPRQLCLLRETLATVSTEAETALALQGLGSYPILQSGNAPTPRPLAARCRAGDVVAGVRAVRARRRLGRRRACPARREPDGDGWRITGEKLWISNAPEADVYSVFARTTPDARRGA